MLCRDQHRAFSAQDRVSSLRQCDRVDLVEFGGVGRQCEFEVVAGLKVPRGMLIKMLLGLGMTDLVWMGERARSQRRDGRPASGPHSDRTAISTNVAIV